jgi:hypothetical protein
MEKTVVVKNRPGTLSHKGPTKDSPVEKTEYFDWRCSHLRSVVGLFAKLLELEGRKVMLCGSCHAGILRGAPLKFVEENVAKAGK